jgi:hypothetical protein
MGPIRNSTVGIMSYAAQLANHSFRLMGPGKGRTRVRLQ